MSRNGHSRDRYRNPDDDLPQDFEARRRVEPVLTRHHTSARLFRFPHLAEGRTAEARDGMRALLAEHGYRNGHVTIDTSDCTSRAASPSG